MKTASSRPTNSALPRKKACEQCSSAKVRCDQKPNGCSRCAKRGQRCVYLGAVPDSTIPPPDRAEKSLQGNHVGFSNPVHAVPLPQARFANSGHQLEPNLDFRKLDLVCNIDASEIQCRWLNAYLPTTAEQTLKTYPPNISSFIDRLLKSYALMVVHNTTPHPPPFIHPLQLSPSVVAASSPLAVCLNVVRLCSSPAPGSEAVVHSTIEREMNRVYEERQSYNDDEITLLGAFQAYLLYAMTMFYVLDRRQESQFRLFGMQLQDLACAVAAEGVVCSAELEQARPRWESWAIAEAKRRTLFTMYLFDNALSVYGGLPTFLGKELQGTLAPGGKALWQASSRESWNTQYNKFIGEWSFNDGPLRIEELWPFPPDFTAGDIANRRCRVDQWLQSVDEFGMALFAVCNCTHGG